MLGFDGAGTDGRALFSKSQQSSLALCCTCCNHLASVALNNANHYVTTNKRFKGFKKSLRMSRTSNDLTYHHDVIYPLANAL